MKHIAPLLAALLLIAGAVNAQNWPQFRGPNTQGHSAETSLPLKWSATENIAWKTGLPGESWSSPIVWGDRVFVTTATDAGVSCRVIALDRKTGAILWNKEVFKQTIRRKEGRNSYATPTPATDGKLVHACFGDGSFVALDFAGRVVWTNRDYPFYGQHGLGTALLLHDGLLIMARDGSSDAEGRIYFVSDNGETTVINAGPEFTVLAKNPLDEMVQASPAISRGQLFIRTERHLYAIGKK